MNVDHANTHGAFVEDVAPIPLSNLCCEINLQQNLQTLMIPEGEISLCTLSAINWGNIKTPKILKNPLSTSIRCIT